MPPHDNIANLDAPCASLKDNLLGAEVALSTPSGYVNGKVKRRKVDPSTKLLIGILITTTPSSILGFMRWKCPMAPTMIILPMF